MKFSFAIAAAAALALMTFGCSSQSEPTAATASTPVSFDSGKYVLSEEPDGAVGIIEARTNAKDGETIVMVGRIGGAVKPWIEGRAAFTMLDASKSVVANGKEAKGNEICLGDCCAIERAACTALVTVVDDRGQVLPVDSRQLFHIAENDMVLVRGKVKKDEAGNFSLVADGVFVRQ